MYVRSEQTCTASVFPAVLLQPAIIFRKQLCSVKLQDYRCEIAFADIIKSLPQAAGTDMLYASVKVCFCRDGT